MKKSKSYKTLLMSALMTLCVATQAMAAGNEGRLLPVDDSYRDVSLQEFLDQLRQIVKFREPESLAPLIYSGVANGKGIADGPAAFAERWRMDALDSELWDELGTILQLGGTFLRSNRGVQYCGPYVFTHFPDELDIYGHGVAIEDNVPLKADPNDDSRVVRTLSYHLVQVNDWRSINDAAGNSWIKVTVMDKGDEGYVLKKQIRSPSDYHVCFLQFERGWRIIAMSASE